MSIRLSSRSAGSVLRSVVRSIGLLGGLLITGVLGYTLIEGWSVLDAVWMVIITITTIGYGEPHPLSAAGRVFTLFFISGGVGVGAYSISQVTQLALEGEIGKLLRERRQRWQMKGMSGHFIVVGYGRLGKAVVAELLDAGVPVCVIEQQGQAAEVHHGGRLVPFIKGDGADDDVLRQAGIERARGVAITAAPVADAVFITLSARQLNKSVPILTRVESDADAIKARRAGATQVVSPHIMGGWRMAHGLVRPNTMNFLDIATLSSREDLLLDEILIDEHSPLIGQTIGALGVARAHRVLVVAIRTVTGEMLPVPGPEVRLCGGEVLIVVGVPAGVRAFSASISR